MNVYSQDAENSSDTFQSEFDDYENEFGSEEDDTEMQTGNIDSTSDTNMLHAPDEEIIPEIISHLKAAGLGRAVHSNDRIEIEKSRFLNAVNTFVSRTTSTAELDLSLPVVTNLSKPLPSTIELILGACSDVRHDISLPASPFAVAVAVSATVSNVPVRQTRTFGELPVNRPSIEQHSADWGLNPRQHYAFVLLASAVLDKLLLRTATLNQLNRTESNTLKMARDRIQTLCMMARIDRIDSRGNTMGSSSSGTGRSGDARSGRRGSGEGGDKIGGGDCGTDNTGSGGDDGTASDDSDLS